MNKKKRVKMILYLSYILTLSVVLISCSKKEGKGEEGKKAGSYSNLDEEDPEPIQEQDLNLEFGEDAAILPGAAAVKLKNTYICYDMDTTGLKEYQDSLIKQGYQLFLEENVGGYVYNHYTNGDNRIQVACAGDNMFISIVRNYQDMELEEGILSSEEVLQLIRDNDQFSGYIEQDTEDKVSIEVSDIVIKHWISDLYEKTNILAYSAYTKQGKDAGTYLIYEGKAYRILDSLEKTCVADINQNGTFELLSLHGFGFGTYRYGNLEFNKVSETEVHLLEEEEIDKQEYNTDEQLQEEQLKEVQIKDYGALTIAEDGEQQYKSIGAIEREVRIGEDGNYYIDFGLHTALFLSSSSQAYTNPSYRGFRVTCEFGDKQICEYVFVVSVAPQWKEEN